jgi:predicted extracellular nuclease
MLKSILFFLALQLFSRASHAQLICLNIQAIQGTGTQSSRLGDIVKVCGATVTSIQYGGFTMQMPPADPNYAASSAMFVRVVTAQLPLNVGDFVNVEGTVFEFTGRTVLDRAYITKRGTSSASFPQVEIQLPVDNVADYNRYESMQVKIVAKSNHDMVIADYEQFDYT